MRLRQRLRLNRRRSKRRDRRKKAGGSAPSATAASTRIKRVGYDQNKTRRGGRRGCAMDAEVARWTPRNFARFARLIFCDLCVKSCGGDMSHPGRKVDTNGLAHTLTHAHGAHTVRPRKGPSLAGVFTR